MNGSDSVLIRTLLTIFELSAIVLSVFGNLLVIHVKTKKDVLWKKSNYYIISMAVADLLNGLIAIPLNLFAVNNFKRVYQSFTKVQISGEFLSN